MKLEGKETEYVWDVLRCLLAAGHDERANGEPFPLTAGGDRSGSRPVEGPHEADAAETLEGAGALRLVYALRDRRGRRPDRRTGPGDQHLARACDVVSLGGYDSSSAPSSPVSGSAPSGRQQRDRGRHYGGPQSTPQSGCSTASAGQIPAGEGARDHPQQFPAVRCFVFHAPDRRHK